MFCLSSSMPSSESYNITAHRKKGPTKINNVYNGLYIEADNVFKGFKSVTTTSLWWSLCFVTSAAMLIYII